MIKIEDIKSELEYCYADTLEEYLGKPLSECDDEHIRLKFDEHASKHSEKIKIKELINEFQKEPFFINTPDGFQEAGDFYIKGPKPLFDVQTKSGFKTICSDDHKFESSKDGNFQRFI
ncbi:MAG: hypothetical protein HC831_18500 [Chloroflexia bacterium]|nr:hypothetical protein [Chloroflexia bacterium]